MKPSRRFAAVLPLALVILTLAPITPAGRAQTPPPPPPAAPTTHQADIAGGRAAAERWLGRVDAGEYGRSWQEAAPHFQRTTTEAKWADLLGNVRLPLGKPASRQTIVGQFSGSMPGMPDGAYVFLQFQTEFERKKLAVETVTCLRDTDGRWKVAGYFIK